MTNNNIILPSLVSVLFGLITYKVFSKEENKIERYVDLPQSTKVTYNTESGGYNAKEEASEFYSVATIPPKSAPATLDIPLPVPTDGKEIPPVIVVDRVADHPSRHRLQENADNIRGDLDIPAAKICPMFNYTTITPDTKVQGILGFGDTVKDPSIVNYLEYEAK
jgi:hypothetical protein